MESRLNIDDYFLSMASLASLRGTCRRRKVGCILVDKHKNVMSTGYNGVPRDHTHCLLSPCPGANHKSGEGLDLCYAIHAEQNALLQCKDVENISICYTTTAPCVTCTKLLLNTGCRKIVILEDYAHSIESKRIWTKFSNNTWELVDNATRMFISTFLKLESANRVS